MIKNKITSKVLLLFICFLIILINIEKKELNIKEETKYVNSNLNTYDIYLLDKENYLAKTTVDFKETDIIEVSQKLIESMKNPPNGFKAVMNEDVKLINVSYNDRIVKLNFNDSLFDINETKVIESLVFSITSLNDVDGVLIFINDKIVNTIDGVVVNQPLTKKIGINKIYDINNLENIETVIVYYLGKYNDQTYYVPVTKYVNDTRDKITIIIDELNNTNLYTTNLMSFMRDDVKLISSTLEEEKLTLNFNEAILEDENYILEEVVNTILYSINDNFNIKSVIFSIENKEILKKHLK